LILLEGDFRFMGELTTRQEFIAFVNSLKVNA
jgi:hypothetical protein